jgi:hypothetical protein
MDSFAEGDPAAERYQTLLEALGHPVISAYEAATLARLASWTDADDVGTLARLIRQARADSPIEGGNQ